MGTGAVGALTKALPCPSPPTATRPSSEGYETTVNAGAAWVWTRSGGVWTQQGTKLVGSGAVGERSTRLLRVPLRRRQHGHRRRVRRQQWRRGRVGLDEERRSLDPAGNQAGRLGRRGERSTRLVPCPSPPTATRPSSEGTSDNSGAGAAWVWTRSGGVWTQQGAKLVGSGAVGDAQQGYSVSLSADGNTAIVGGSTATTVALGPRGSGRGAEESGPSREPSWSARAPWGTLDKAIPCPSPPTATRPSSEGTIDNGNTGAAWVWTRSGGVWTQQGTKLVGSGAVGNAQQGYSVSLSADGNTAIVGGNDDNSAAGAAWVWTRSGGVWTQQSTKLVGSGAVGNANQGDSVSLSADGNTAIVGGPGDNSGAGAAWVFAAGAAPGLAQFSQQGPKLVGTGAVGTLNSLNKAIPCPSPPTATRPSSEGTSTTISVGPPGSGPGAVESGPSRDQAGRLGRRGDRSTRQFRVPLRRRQHRHRRRVPRQR